jgi:hypothetical protein
MAAAAAAVLLVALAELEHLDKDMRVAQVS